MVTIISNTPPDKLEYNEKLKQLFRLNLLIKEQELNIKRVRGFLNENITKRNLLLSQLEQLQDKITWKP